MPENQITEKNSEFFSQIGRKGGQAKSTQKTAAVRKNGRKGGLAISSQKADAVRENGRKGGRKPIPDNEMTEAQIKRRERYNAQKEFNKYSDL